jgi:hypothetical protein
MRMLLRLMLVLGSVGVERHRHQSGPQGGREAGIFRDVQQSVADRIVVGGSVAVVAVARLRGL